MKNNVFLKSTLRQPVKMALLTLVLALITFAFVSRASEYLLIRQETERLGSLYRTVGTLEAGEPWTDMGPAADWLEDIGAVDDAGYAAALVRHYGGKGYGPARVKEELRRRGVDRALWDAALEEMPDPAEVLDKLIQKRCRGDLSDPGERRRTSDALLRRGFAWRDVKAAMGRYAEMEEDGWE